MGSSYGSGVAGSDQKLGAAAGEVCGETNAERGELWWAGGWFCSAAGQAPLPVR